MVYIIFSHSERYNNRIVTWSVRFVEFFSRKYNGAFSLDFFARSVFLLRETVQSRGSSTNGVDHPYSRSVITRLLDRSFFLGWFHLVWLGVYIPSQASVMYQGFDLILQLEVLICIMAIVSMEATVLHLVSLFERSPYSIGSLKISLVFYFYKDLRLRYPKGSALMKLSKLVPCISRLNMSIFVRWLLHSLFISSFSSVGGDISFGHHGLLDIVLLGSH